MQRPCRNIHKHKAFPSCGCGAHGCHVLHVTQMHVRSELERLFSAVLTNVCPENGGSGKRFDTMWTLVGSFSAVNPHVFIEAG